MTASCNSSSVSSSSEDDYEEEDEDFDHEDCDCDECRLNGVGGSCYNQFDSFIDHLKDRGFEYLSSGDFRYVYRRKNIVIKVPSVNDGIVDNKVEAAAWRKYKNKETSNGLFLAPCRLLPNGCLMMVFVERIWDDKPEWSKQIDHCQVGKYKGRIVTYDYALDMPERVYWEEEWNLFSVFFNEEYLDRKPSLRKQA